MDEAHPIQEAIGILQTHMHNATNERENDRNYGYNLGSDDPLWPKYLKEAEKYDDMMVDKWDKKMETLLLFATLFSAIVTAFVIESSQNMQPDNAAITATAIVEIAGILRNRSGDNQQIPTVLLSPDEFQPSTSAFIVNFVWFISLCLSITVALLAGLVKQWCNTLRWDRTAPPCSQARIRQARANTMARWRTGLVISALPVIMDSALGLFLIGLLAFLRDLDYIIYVAALVVIMTTAAFYFGTTLAPCFVSFCPYETALSSRKTWGFFYQLGLAAIIEIKRVFYGDQEGGMKADLINYMSPCEKHELETASKTKPDELTGDALNWIILHAQDPLPRQMAIRAIASIDSKETLEQLVAEPPGILPQVIQSFTSCFKELKEDNGVINLVLKDSTDTNKASLHGQALTVLVRQALISNKPEEHPVRAASVSDIEADVSRSKWVIESTVREAVKARFEWLGRLQYEEGSKTKAWAFVGLSAWHDFIGYDKGLRFNQGKVVWELAESLNRSLPSSLCNALIQTLTREISHWAPNAKNDYKRKTIGHLVDLISESNQPPNGLELRSKLAYTLTVLSLSLNHGSPYLLSPDFGSHSRTTGVNYQSKLLEAITKYYNSNNQALDQDGQSLMLFALTGLMEYYEHYDFDEEALENMKKIAEQLEALGHFGKLKRILIPIDEGTNMPIDPQAYFVNVLLLYLKSPQTPGRRQHMDEVLVSLLKSISRTRQNWELEEYGPQILPLVIQILIQTTDTSLQEQCLSTIISPCYWSEGSSYLYSRMLLFYETPSKLVRLTKYHTQSRQPNSIIQSMISSVFEKMGEQVQHFNDGDNTRLASCLNNLIREDLLGVFLDSLHIRNKVEHFVSSQQDRDPHGTRSEQQRRPTLLEKARSYLKNQLRGSGQIRGGELLLDSMIKAFDKSKVTEVVGVWTGLNNEESDNPGVDAAGASTPVPETV